MHEMSLAQSIVRLAEEQARGDGFVRVTKVFLTVGALAHVDPRALEFGFEVVARGTVAEGAALVWERRPAKAFCLPCGTMVDVNSRSEPCPRCGDFGWLLQQGEELRITELEVE
jgi:hydrogenase nickel incorporation protein HypA/HybF